MKNKFMSPFRNFDIKQVLITGLFVSLLFCLSVGVVFVQHVNRAMNGMLQELSNEQEKVNNEKNQLLLEQATWTSGIRIERVASEKLKMAMPNKIEMIKP